MISVTAFLNACVAHHGKAYSTTNRFGPNAYDCSGHIWAALAACGFRWGATVSSTMYASCHPIPLGAAVRTPGSLIFMPQDPLQGDGASGHVAGVLNPYGYTTEARGHAWGVGSWPIAGRGFSTLAGLIPMVDYTSGGGGGGVPPVVVPSQVIKGVASLVMLAVNAGDEPLGTAGTGQTLSGRNSSGDQVTAWQSALNLTMHAGLDVDGDYGPQTARWTGSFQRFYNYIAGANVLNLFGIVDNGKGLDFHGRPAGPVRAAMVQALENLIQTL